MPSKMERFTQSARRSLSTAQVEAERMQYPEINIGHMLLGLMQEEGTIAAIVLKEAGIELEKARQDVDAGGQHGPSPDAEAMTLADNVKRMLELAVDEARKRSHTVIAPEHLLLGIVRYQNNNSDLFDTFGLAPETIRAAIERRMSEPDYRPDADMD
ncbi:MAG: hypothetical protein KC496_16065 [Anaerolineae bacterium]|nr:hypothetical protein [Anaerolineae bacterium]